MKISTILRHLTIGLPPKCDGVPPFHHEDTSIGGANGRPGPPCSECEVARTLNVLGNEFEIGHAVSDQAWNRDGPTLV